MRCRRQRAFKLEPNAPLLDVVVDRLRWGWSPEQIARILKRFRPDDASQRVSHETIYTSRYVMPRGELRRN